MVTETFHQPVGVPPIADWRCVRCAKLAAGAGSGRQAIRSVSLKTMLAVAVVVIIGCAAALLYSRFDDTPVLRPVTAVAAPAPAVHQMVPANAPAADEAADLPPPGEPDLQTQFDQALEAHDVAIERFLIVGRAISRSRLALLAADDNYDRYVVRLQTEASQQALNDTAAFQQYLQGQDAAASGSVDVADLVCGAAVCTASVLATENNKITAYYTGLTQARPGNGPPKPIYSMLYVPFKTSTGFGMRLLFSIDGAINSTDPSGP
jgi:hypothetical protein